MSFPTIVANFAVSRYPECMRPKKPSDVLAAAKTTGFLVSNLTNIRYLTGVELSTGFVLIKPRNMTLFVDGRYTEAAKKGRRRGVQIASIDTLPKVLSKVRLCGFESEDVTVERFASWKRKIKNTKFVQKKGIVEEFRRSKGPDELRHFREAQVITQKLIASVPKRLKRGVSEKGLAELLRRAAVDMGADELSFDPIVAFGENSALPHHHPTDRILKKGEIVQIDIGARVNGYCADQSAVFFTGKKTAKQTEVLDAVAEAKAAAIEAVKVGVETSELDLIARKVLKKYKLEKYFVHSLGHGVGLDIHEGVTLSCKAKPMKLLKNEVITIEPGVYIPGQFGIRLEEEVIVGR